MGKLRLKLLELLDKSKPGDVVLMTSNKALSGLIREFTHSDYSHTAIVVDKEHILESTIGGVRVVKLKIYDDGEHPDFILLRSRTLEEKQRTMVVSRALSFVGYRYSYLQLIWSFILRLFGKSENIKWQRDLTPNAMHCSEAVARAYLAANIAIKDRYDPSGIEPNDFIESGEFYEVYKIDS